MYISNSSEKHIFDNGLDVFLYFIITVVFSVVVFIFDAGDLLVEASLNYDDSAIQISITNSLSVSGFLFFVSIAYDFWSRYNSVFAKEKCIFDILLILWIVFFLIAIMFLIFVFMGFNKTYFISKQASILSVIKAVNYTAIIPIVISVIEGFRFIIEYHKSVVEKNTKKANREKQDYYRESSV